MRSNTDSDEKRLWGNLSSFLDTPVVWKVQTDVRRRCFDYCYLFPDPLASELVLVLLGVAVGQAIASQPQNDAFVLVAFRTRVSSSLAAGLCQYTV